MSNSIPMMNNLAGHVSGQSSPHGIEENMSMFFEFGPSAQAQRPYQQSETLNQDAAPRGGIRVSLACIPCRSRHVKCGAEMPSCSRCLQDDKPCFYAKSRRGMRDRNATRKKSSPEERASPNLDNQFHGNNSMVYAVGSSSNDPYGYSSDVSASPSSSSSRTVNSRRLVDLYYNFFYKAHPFVLPRYYFFTRLENDPESLKHLRVVMEYIGSLYAPDVPSASYKEKAMSQIDLPTMPPNAFTVQALLLTALALHFDNEMGKGREILDRAIFLALELRMNTSDFANMERDPVVAESWRRTYWGLYISDATFAGIRRAPSFMLFSIDASVHLPCEDCDYSSGVIPQPKTLSEYEARDFEDAPVVFSSFSYLIDLTRIVGSLLNLDRLPVKEREPAVANADAMLVNWKLHLPPEKQGVVDKDEQIDEMLFRAQMLLNVLLIFIHRPLSRLIRSPIENISICASPTSPSNLLSERTLWLHTRKTLEAAESAIDLLALPCPIQNHSPHVSCSITISLLACISACCYVLSGQEWRRTRDRIRLGLGALKVFGSVWRTGRRTESECKKIARSVFSEGQANPDIMTHGTRQSLHVAEQDSGDQDFIRSNSTGALGGPSMSWQGQDIEYLAFLGSTEKYGVST